METIQWNPWHGCHKCSDGCKNCYVYYLDHQRGRDASVVTRNKGSFLLPIRRNRSGNYKIPSGSEVYTCFTSDFFVEDADIWRNEAWQMIRLRQDLRFLIPTKRVSRLAGCLPEDWGTGYDNVTFAVSVENRKAAEARLPLFLDLPLKHRQIFLCPLLEYVDVRPYLQNGSIEKVSAGGESYEGARMCDFDWVRRIYADCRIEGVEFDFHQSGSNLRVDGKSYSIPHNKEYEQAKRAMARLRTET